MNFKTYDKGVIDSIDNPFILESWIKQNYGFTLKRQKQAEALFGRSIENILNTKTNNENRYVAFVAIRWGFAKIVDEILIPTERWNNRQLYNNHGMLIK